MILMKWPTVAWWCCMTSQFQIILGLRGGQLPNGQWAISYFSFDLILRFSAVCFVSVFFSRETNSDLLCVDEKFQSWASAGQWPIHFKCTILALVLVSGTDEKTHGELFYWNITDYIWYLQAAGRSRLLRPGQANFVFWGRLLQGGHVCPESLREFMVSFLAYIS